MNTAEDINEDRKADFKVHWLHEWSAHFWNSDFEVALKTIRPDLEDYEKICSRLQLISRLLRLTISLLINSQPIRKSLSSIE